MKMSKWFWGIGFIVAAVLILLDGTGLLLPLSHSLGGVSILSVFLGLLLVAFIITRLIKGRVASIFFPLAFLFLLFEKNLAFVCRWPTNLINNWLVLLIALLLTIGVAILFPRGGRRRIAYRTVSRFETYGNQAECSLGASTVYVDCATMSPCNIENSLGSCRVHFENPNMYAGSGVLYVENNLGSMVIYVPSSWEVKASVENNLGSVSIPPSPVTGGPELSIRGENNLGSLTIKYI